MSGNRQKYIIKYTVPDTSSTITIVIEQGVVTRPLLCDGHNIQGEDKFLWVIDLSVYHGTWPCNTIHC